MLNCKSINVGPLSTNCYFLIDAKTSECVVVDPGGDVEDIIGTVESLNVIPKKIFLTHGHIDHIAVADILAERLGVPLFIHVMDSKLMKDPILNLSLLMGDAKIIERFEVFENNCSVDVGNTPVNIYNTPGHTPGSCSFYFDDEMVCGDLLFKDGVGRTDLPLGDEEKLRSSIRWLCENFQGDLKVHPGHGESTTLKREIASNYYLKYIF